MTVIIQLYAADGIEAFEGADNEINGLAVDVLESAVPVLAFDLILEKS